jgi:phage gpG-like protein
MRIEVTIVGDVALDRRLAEMAARAEHPQAALDAVGDDFLHLEAARFAGGAGWQPLSAAYARRKAFRGRSTRPLVGGLLEDSLTRSGTRFSVRQTDQHSILMGTSDPVAHLHQKGTKGPSGKGMPARKLVDIRSSDRLRWRELIRRNVFGTVTAGGGL